MSQQMNIREKSHTQTRAIRAFITERISAGDWAPGDSLPTERALSAEYGIARNTVRALLHELEREGVIVRHIGKGTYVADKRGNAKGMAASGISDASPSDIMEVRLLTEPGIGELAVLRATQADFGELQKCLERSEAARSWREFERWDAAFHEALALATKNHAVIDILKSINAARDEATWGVLKKKSLTAARRKIYQRQHRAILAALRKRESERAQIAIRQHLLAVRENLLGY
jgi:DNA-binding FadR family transcriptional regulator